jgi:hypothetical protein
MAILDVRTVRADMALYRAKEGGPEPVDRVGGAIMTFRPHPHRLDGGFTAARIPGIMDVIPMGGVFRDAFRASPLPF